MIKPITRVAAVHDISGFGTASLTVVIPILSTMKIQVCPFPTAVLSNHSAFNEYSFLDLTEHMKSYLDHWKKLNLDFDAIYSGFLGSPQQVNLVIELIEYFKKDDTITIVDPVLGDDGILYTPLSESMVSEMRKLISYSDIITPNITEVSLLLGEKYADLGNKRKLKNSLLALSDFGPSKIIITSVPDALGKNNSSVVAYDRVDGRFWQVQCSYIPANFPGTGDTFTSVLTGSILQGDSLPIALDRAVQFVSIAIRATFGHSTDPLEGIFLERVLENLNAPVQISSYELLEW
jgi:pyridoxine kinase